MPRSASPSGSPSKKGAPRAAPKPKRTTRARQKMPEQDPNSARNRTFSPTAALRAQKLRAGEVSITEEPTSGMDWDGVFSDGEQDGAGRDPDPDEAQVRMEEGAEEGYADADGYADGGEDADESRALVVVAQPYDPGGSGESFAISEELVEAARKASGRARQGGRDRRYEMEWVPIGLLIPADYNPRIMPTEEMDHLEDSLEQFGMVEPIVVNTFPGREGVIIGGHQRLRGAAQAGWTHVAVIWTYESLSREKALNLALNRIHGQWDDHLLAQVMADLRDEGDIDLGATGFSDEEIAELLAASSSVEEAIDLGDPTYDSEKVVDGIELVIHCPPEEYDSVLEDAVSSLVSSLRGDYPHLTLQVKKHAAGGRG